MKRKLLVLTSVLALMANTDTIVHAANKSPEKPLSSRNQTVLSGTSVNLNETVIVAESKPYTSTGPAVQRFVDYVNLKAGQDKLKLTLTFYNTGFNWVNVSLAGHPILSNVNIAKKQSLSVDITGKISPGSSQIVISGGAPSGATLSWELSAPKPKVSSVKPETLGFGEELKIEGTNLSPIPASYSVSIGNKKAKVSSAANTQINTIVPDNVDSGKQKVEVAMFGESIGNFVVTIKSAPELTSMNLMSAAPSQHVIIEGKNFSPNLSDNKVLFNGTPGTVVSGSTTSLDVIIPEIESPQYDVQVTVQVGSIQSKNSLPIMIQSRTF